MENTQTVAGGWSWQWAEWSTLKLSTDLVNAITFIGIFIHIFSTIFSSSIFCKLLKLFVASTATNEPAASSITETCQNTQVKPTPAPSSQNSWELCARMLQTVAAIITYKWDLVFKVDYAKRIFFFFLVNDRVAIGSFDEISFLGGWGSICIQQPGSCTGA